MYDLVIVGGGPAGLSAAVYAARYRIKAVVIAKIIGGKLLEANRIENYPGFKSIRGMRLAERMKEQVLHLGGEIIEAEAVDIKRGYTLFNVFGSDNRKYQTKAIILAMGMSHKKLGIPGEEEFLGKGVSYCAVCDAPFFKDKGVAVIGGSDTAAHSALLLTKYASKVIVICRRGELTAAPAYKAMLEGNKGIEIKTNTSVAEISGDGMVSSLLLGSGERIGVEGVFIESGGVPAAVLAGKLGIKLDDEGFIVTDPMQRTNVEGLFAAGDVTSVKMKQILWATSQGAVAASSAYEFIKEH